MKKTIYKIKAMKHYSFVISVVLGLVVLISEIVLFSFICSFSDVPDLIVEAGIAVSVASAGAVCGYSLGRQKRKRGIFRGALCAGAAVAILSLSGIIIFKSLPSLSFWGYSLLLIISGAAGGVKGVNTKLKRPPF